MISCNVAVQWNEILVGISKLIQRIHDASGTKSWVIRLMVMLAVDHITSLEKSNGRITCIR